MTVPPLLAGATKLTEACALPGIAVTPVGAPGTVTGITGLDGAEAGPVPTALVAVTVKVYAVPLVKPVITCVVAVLHAVELAVAYANRVVLLDRGRIVADLPADRALSAAASVFGMQAGVGPRLLPT